MLAGWEKRDRVAELYFAFIGQAGGNDVFCGIPCDISPDPVYPQRIFAAEGRSTMAGISAESIDGDLSPGKAGMDGRSAEVKDSLGIDEYFGEVIGLERFVPENLFYNRLPEVRAQSFDIRPVGVLLTCRNGDAVNAGRLPAPDSTPTSVFASEQR